MIHELYEAKDQQHSHEKMVKHIANVRLLCDLFLEEDDVSVKESGGISKAEWKAMLGETERPKIHEEMQHSAIDHDDANGDSIFDF